MPQAPVHQEDLRQTPPTVAPPVGAYSRARPPADAGGEHWRANGHEPSVSDPNGQDPYGQDPYGQDPYAGQVAPAPEPPTGPGRPHEAPPSAPPPYRGGFRSPFSSGGR